MSVLTRINNVRKSTNLVDIMPITTLIVLIIIMIYRQPAIFTPGEHPGTAGSECHAVGDGAWRDIRHPAGFY